jgi:pyrroloquinoline quinone biosynthesis protein B
MGFAANSGTMKFKILEYIIAAALILVTGPTLHADNKAPYLYILGVAQDAGYPQTGCYAEHCLPGWRDPLLKRPAVSLGLVDPVNSRKYIFEATPDFPAQLYKLEMEAPSEQFELAGIFLTHAHHGHYTGLMFLGHEAMGASGVPVYAMPRMKHYLETNGPWSQLVDFKNIVLKPLQAGGVVSLGLLKVTPFQVPHRDEYSETAGYRIDGPNKSAVFIPDINKWSQWQTDLTELVKTVDYALLDATFYADGELPGRDMSKIPHPFVVESMQLLEELPLEQRNKVWFIHFNHTNPLLDPQSDAGKTVRQQGFNIAVEGIRLTL